MSVHGWTPTGTVYGTLLNFQHEWALWTDRMTQPPHLAAPHAPVLYVKTANPGNTNTLLRKFYQGFAIVGDNISGYGQHKIMPVFPKWPAGL